MSAAVRRPPVSTPVRRGSVAELALPTAASAAQGSALPRSSVAPPPGAVRHAAPEVRPHLVTREELETLVKEAVLAAVGEGVFLPNKLTAWTGNIVEGVLKRLAALNKPLKYIVNTHVVQKVGAGLHTSAAAFWDPSTDGKACVLWESASMQVVTTVFYLNV